MFPRFFSGGGGLNGAPWTVCLVNKILRHIKESLGVIITFKEQIFDHGMLL